MKKVIFLSVFLLTLGCSTNVDKSHKEIINSSFYTQYLKLKHLDLPYKLTVNLKSESDFYLTNLDSFLVYHSFETSTNPSLNSYFHQNTIDFVSSSSPTFMHYPFLGKAVAVSKLKLGKNLCGIIFSYLVDSEVVQPRMEIQTFTKKGVFVDALIVSSGFMSDCTGKRDFELDRNLEIEVKDTFNCNEEMGGNGELYVQTSKFLIDSRGFFKKIYPERLINESRQ